MICKNIAYIRVSTLKQDNENQKHKILAYANEKKIIVDDFIEVEISSKKSQVARKLDYLIDTLSDGDTLLVTELSRLGRNMLQILNLIDELSKKNINIIFVNQPELSIDNHNPLSQLILAFYGYIAQNERTLISERTKQALQVRKDNGIKLGHNRLFLKSIFDHHTKEILEHKELKLSYNAICKILNHKYANRSDRNVYKGQNLNKWFNNRFEYSFIFKKYVHNKKFRKYLDL